MLTFRRKIFLSDLIIFIVFLILLFPFIDQAVKKVVRSAVEDRAEKLVGLLKTAPNTPAMIEIMQTNPAFLYQPAVLLNGEGDLIYRSYTPLIEETDHLKTSQEVQDATKLGRGYIEKQTPVAFEKFAKIAIAFFSHGEKYILEMNIIFYEVEQATLKFEWIFVIACALMLGFYIFMNQAILYRVTQPIQQIINAIRPYQEGKEEFPSPILLPKVMQGDEFNKLAFTLNSLTERIKNQVENLMRQRKETETILETLGEGVVATDTSARVTFANQAACRMLGIGRDSLMKQMLDSVKAQSKELSKKCHELILHSLQTSEPIIQTWTTRERGPVYLDLNLTPLAHQKGALLVIQDKTSDYKVVEMGKDFVANASHELRTPITIIRGFAETLQDLPELSQEMLRDITEKIVRTCGRLEKLVRSLLTLADIGHVSEERFKPANLVALAQNCEQLILTAHPQIQLSLKSDIDEAPIIADADLMELAIINLLENSIKYSQPPVKIEMEVHIKGEEVHLSVKDNGIGISENDLPHIFERFYTVDKARTRKMGGAGLGLSIVKTIIDKHRGQIQVTSQLGKGAIFTIILPLGD